MLGREKCCNYPLQKAFIAVFCRPAATFAASVVVVTRQPTITDRPASDPASWRIRRDRVLFEPSECADACW